MRAEVDRHDRGQLLQAGHAQKLDDASLKGIVESLERPLLALLHARGGEGVRPDGSAASSRASACVEQDKRGLGLSVFDGSPAQARRDPQGRPDHRGRTASRSPASRRPGDRRKIKGTAGHLGRSSRSPRRGETTPRTRHRQARQRIDVPVAQRPDGRPCDGKKIGVVAAVHLQRGRPRRAAPAGRQAARQGAKGIVLDLRGNGGGLLARGRARGSIFIEDGTDRLDHGRAPRRSATTTPTGDAIDAEDPGRRAGRRRHAPAPSEIVTGALRDHKRATVVGHATRSARASSRRSSRCRTAARST